MGMKGENGTDGRGGTPGDMVRRPVFSSAVTNPIIANICRVYPDSQEVTELMAGTVHLDGWARQEKR